MDRVVVENLVEPKFMSYDGNLAASNMKIPVWSSSGTSFHVAYTRTA